MSRLIAARSVILLIVAGVCANVSIAESSDPKLAATDCKIALDAQDFTTGMEHCRTAAKYGDRASAFRIGELYEYGLGVEKSIQHASNWYRRSAARGYPLAQRNLAALYERGDSGLQDNWRAFELYKKAAIQGEIYSQYKVGLMYLAGVGVEPDEAAGLDWIGKSANGGLPEAANFAANYLERMAAKTLWVRQKLAPYWRKPELGDMVEPPRPRNDALAALSQPLWTVSHQQPLIRRSIAPAVPAGTKTDRTGASAAGTAPRVKATEAMPVAANEVDHTRRLLIDVPNDPDAASRITLVPKAAVVGAEPKPLIPTASKSALTSAVVTTDLKQDPKTEGKTANKAGAKPAIASAKPVAEAAAGVAPSVAAANPLEPSPVLTKKAATAPVTTGAIMPGIEKAPAAALKEPLLVASNAPLAAVAVPKPAAATTKPQLPATAAESGGGQLLAAHAPDHYTVQLALMGKETSVDRFYRRYGMRDDVKYYATRIDGKLFFVLAYGDFASLAEAKAAAEALPSEIQKLRPWVRLFRALQQEYPPIDADA